MPYCVSRERLIFLKARRRRFDFGWEGGILRNKNASRRAAALSTRKEAWLRGNFCRPDPATRAGGTDLVSRQKTSSFKTERRVNNVLTLYT